MEKTVMKRDGRVVPFDRERITSAITKALKSVGGEDCTEKINNIAREVEDSVVGTAHRSTGKMNLICFILI